MPVDLERRSELWPERLAVQIPLTGETHGNSIKPGHEGVFLRVESGKCLVDLGHNGIFPLEIEDTDLLERAKATIQSRTFASQGLFTYRYTKSFFSPGTYRGYQLGDFDAYDRFLLFYFDYQVDSEAVSFLSELISEYQETMEKELSLGILLIPRGDILVGGGIDAYLADGLTAPTVTPFLREGTIHTLSHNADEKGDVVLVDKNGRILGRTFLKEFNDVEHFFGLLEKSAKEHASSLK